MTSIGKLLIFLAFMILAMELTFFLTGIAVELSEPDAESLFSLPVPWFRMLEYATRLALIGACACVAERKERVP